MKWTEIHTFLHEDGAIFHLGIDIGSTTVKAVAIEPRTGHIVYSRYLRHNARQIESVVELLCEISAQFLDARFRLVFCGSGGSAVAECIGAQFVQEVIANSIIVRKEHPRARTAIELGGQDAKVIFFDAGNENEEPSVSDMRMNGSCAGGTGAFIDEIATLLQVSVEEFENLAQRGSKVYDISGRCGVYAKTDIQPLLNQGARREDIALSTFHAIAKQTIGGLAQGLDMEAPLVFVGGPLAFNPTLVKVFQERLELTSDEVIVPHNSELFVALGAALSIEELPAREEEPRSLASAIETLCDVPRLRSSSEEEVQVPFFATPEEKKAFEERYPASSAITMPYKAGETARVYLGIDSGSTTTKLVLLNEQEEVVDQFYAANEGKPLDVLQTALVELHEKYEQRGIALEVIAVGTTGYGELLFHKALNADYHVVETVAHAQAAKKYIPNVSFILDIGGQDMKAMFLDEGVITNIIVNEACSSGCGSFLESFARTLGMKVDDIAEAAFNSKNPAVLGSRCTVFMNSRIVTEQKNGKRPEDIVAGLSRSIIENVFTKFIRTSRFETLGPCVVVQGGTFKNDAVLRAFEQYIGSDVTRAPYPGIMGAIGVALLTKKHIESQPGTAQESSFIGLEALKDFSYVQEANVTCPFCLNQCSRSLVTFSNGQTWVTGNRCERGEVVGDPKDAAVKESVRAVLQRTKDTPNLFEEREELLFCEHDYTVIDDLKNVTIGLPRVLEFWNSMPFWRTFFQALGFEVKMSQPTTREMYEKGLSSVTSDTVCFPAKLAHGHIRDLVEAGVDRIFMPSITTMESENTAKTSESVCAVVKGYPMVIEGSDNPQQRWGVSFDCPLFHWYTMRDRNRQLCAYMKKTFGIAPAVVLRAIEQGDASQMHVKNTLQKRGKEVIEQAEAAGNFAVVLASRPYQNDTLVNHDLPTFFTRLGIPVLTVDSVPGTYETDLGKCRLDIVNNFHTRMLSSAIITAKNSALEYVQIVSFGCGHDALLSDEIIRLMKETSGKVPLVLKLDESDIHGPLHIRVESFVETVRARRALDQNPEVRELQDPYPIKYEKPYRKEKIILVPNVSRAFCRVMTAAIANQGVRAEPLPFGGENAILLGKKYVHNDICFPAQVTIGEALNVLESGLYDPNNVAVGTGKLIGDCRLTHYAALLRKALDDAGYEQVPIITNDAVDQYDIHPGYRMSIRAQACVAFALPMIDVLEQLLRKIRPYERAKGEANRIFNKAIECLSAGIEKSGVRGGIRAFKQAIKMMRTIEYDRTTLRPSVFIIGEYLLNFHPDANNNIEAYLEANGLEVIEPQMTNVYHKWYFYQYSQIREYKVKKPLPEKTWLTVAHRLFETAHSVVDRIARSHPLYEVPQRLAKVTKASDSILHHTYDSGEGFLVPAEIIHHAEAGVRSFVVLQPFGCIPNHICGRGVIKPLKERYPDVQILPLDFDPDTSFANVENRLQMLIMNAHAASQNKKDVLLEKEVVSRTPLTENIKKDFDYALVHETR